MVDYAKSNVDDFHLIIRFYMKMYTCYSDALQQSRINKSIGTVTNKDVEKRIRKFKLLLDEFGKTIRFEGEARGMMFIEDWAYIAYASSVNPNLGNSGNYKKMLKRLGLSPINIKYNSLLSLIVDSFIYQGPIMRTKNPTVHMFWTLLDQKFPLSKEQKRLYMTEDQYFTYFPGDADFKFGNTIYLSTKVTPPQVEKVQDAWEGESKLEKHVGTHTSLETVGDTVSVISTLLLSMSQTERLVRSKSYMSCLRSVFDLVLTFMGNSHFANYAIDHSYSVSDFIKLYEQLLRVVQKPLGMHDDDVDRVVKEANDDLTNTATTIKYNIVHGTQVVSRSLDAINKQLQDKYNTIVEDVVPYLQIKPGEMFARIVQKVADKCEDFAKYKTTDSQSTSSRDGFSMALRNVSETLLLIRTGDNSDETWNYLGVTIGSAHTNAIAQEDNIMYYYYQMFDQANEPLQYWLADYKVLRNYNPELVKYAKLFYESSLYIHFMPPALKNGGCSNELKRCAIDFSKFLILRDQSMEHKFEIPYDKLRIIFPRMHDRILFLIKEFYYTPLLQIGIS